MFEFSDEHKAPIYSYMVPGQPNVKTLLMTIQYNIGSKLKNSL